MPPGVDDPTVYRQRSSCILPRTADWWGGSRPMREVWTAGEPAREAHEAPVSGS